RDNRVLGRKEGSSMTRRRAWLAWWTLLSLASLLLTTVPASATGTRSHAADTSEAGGTQLWVQRYNGPASLDEYGNAVAVNPGGTKVFVTGSSDEGPSNAPTGS